VVGDAGRRPLEPGKPLRLRFGVFIHDTASGAPLNPAAEYEHVDQLVAEKASVPFTSRQAR